MQEVDRGAKISKAVPRPLDGLQDWRGTCTAAFSNKSWSVNENGIRFLNSVMSFYGGLRALRAPPRSFRREFPAPNHSGFKKCINQSSVYIIPALQRIEGGSQSRAHDLHCSVRLAQAQYASCRARTPHAQASASICAPWSPEAARKGKSEKYLAAGI